MTAPAVYAARRARLAISQVTASTATPAAIRPPDRLFSRAGRCGRHLDPDLVPSSGCWCVSTWSMVAAASSSALAQAASSARSRARDWRPEASWATPSCIPSNTRDGAALQHELITATYDLGYVDRWVVRL